MTWPTCHRIKLILIFSFVRLALLSVSSDNSHGLVHCSSSYIDDYFLPTAKIALNKIQQSFSPANLDPESVKAQPNRSATSDSERASIIQQQIVTTTSGSSDGLKKTSSDSSSASSEPNTNEFVHLEVRPDGGLEPSVVDVSQRNKTDEVDPPALVVSSTEMSSDDPATTSAGESSSPSASLDLDTTSQVSDDSTEVVSVSANEQSASTTGTTTAAAATEASDDKQQAADNSDNQIVKSADEAVRETELEAIAAVDASIVFGDSFATTSDACYDEYGNARYCEPEFENVAFERQVEVSSECGHPPSRFCTTNLNERNDQIRNCHICDAQHPKKRHPSAFLTDMNNPNAPTCWVSAPISAATISSSNSSLDAGVPGDASASQPQQSIQRDNVTLTINLEKRYEITYMSLQFCSLKPDSLAIWKSADFGKTWSPYQFYSSQCARFYDRPTTAGGPGGQLRAESGQAEATCANTSAPSSGSQSGRIAFSTSLSEAPEERNKQAPSDKTPALQDWITATNIRIVLDRHQASWIQSNLAHSHHHALQHSQQRFNAPGPANNPSRSNVSAVASPPSLRPQDASSLGSDKLPQALALSSSPFSGAQAGQPDQLETSLTNPSDTYNYAVSDLTIGGRCKCNGHASRCVHNGDGQLQCDCQHNTDGPDCERCLPLHHDRPWQRATQANANPCQPCTCNGHSRKCRFDPELYLLSGKRSGGVCIDCKDNTTGRHCNYCKEGFTRDHTKPMSDQGACKPCDCHPVGSLGKVCNHVTGQCPCKEGVTGPECNRCAPGYQQSSSPTEPCIRIPENDINYEPLVEVAAAEDEQQTSSVSHQTDSEQEPSVDEGERSKGARLPPVPAPDKPARQPAKPAPDNNRIDSVISSDELGPTYEQQPASPGEFDGLRPASVHRSRQRQPQHRPAHSQWYGYPPASRHSDHLGGGGGGGKQRHRPGQFMSHQGDELDELEVMRGIQRGLPDDQDDQYEGGRQPAGYHRSMYYQPAGKRLVPGYADYRQQMGPVRQVASLDHDQADGEQLAESGQDERPTSYVAQDVPSAIYAQPADDANFNQIMRPRYNNIGNRYHLHRQQQQQQQQQQQNRRRLLPNGRAQSSLNCAGCQARTKKLNAKQFCHLDYAVRATVISKRVSSDWTRFEVEIQDIFKSPSSSSLLQPVALQGKLASASGGPIEPVQKSSSYLIDSSSGGAVQSDDPSVVSGADAAANQTQSQLSAEQAANLIPGAEHPIHRLRIGSIQSIWVPTEDVACKCPRLKLHSSYLLMGLVDTRENSAASTQLDRHGVSMIWRPSLQEKLIKYQRLHSDGLCWRAAAAAA